MFSPLVDRFLFTISIWPGTISTVGYWVTPDEKDNSFAFLQDEVPAAIPIYPMTGTTEWGLRAMQDDPDSDSWMATMTLVR